MSSDPFATDGEREITLHDLHDAPWSTIAGATVRVRTDDGERQGEIAGRHTGWKVKYHPDTGEFADPVSPMIVIETPAETFLEVATNTHDNELLDADIQQEAGDNG